MKYVHANGERLCVSGRRIPTQPPLTQLHFGDFVSPSLPPPPPRVYWDQRNVAGVSDAYRNDEIGDCGYAGWMHLWDIWNPTTKATSDDVLWLYKACEPAFDEKRALAGDPNADPGADLESVLRFVQDKGAFPDGRGRIAAWIRVDPTNWQHVKQAIWLFGGVYAGACMPDAWPDNFTGQSGFTWDLAGHHNPDNAHCIPLSGYAEDIGAVCMTWGKLGTITPRAIANYFASAQGGEMYAPVSLDWPDRVTLKAPSGFDIAGLESALKGFSNA